MQLREHDVTCVMSRHGGKSVKRDYDCDPVKLPVVSLNTTFYIYCLVLVYSRNGFELKKAEALQSQIYASIHGTIAP